MIADAAKVLGPVGGASYPRGYDRLAGTGTTEDSTASKLPPNCLATILAGNVALRFSLRGATGGSTQVATTDPIIPANGRFDWTVVRDATDVVYVEAADGSSAYEAWVWQSSPGDGVTAG